jgi:ribosomal protein S12 methylthiotransferase accessory factor
VTRVARLTGLDRTGVPVAAAIRPAGHVLQVSNGKGETFGRAVAGALLEAAELWAAERPAVAAWGAARDLEASARLLAPADLGDAGSGSREVRLAWSAARDLQSAEPVLVPAHAVHCPPPGAAWLGPALLPWTSNGMGAHPEAPAALLHALLEAIERDRLARALPDGFTEREVARRLVDPRSLPDAAPRTARWVERIERRGFRAYLFDLSALRGDAESVDSAPPDGRRRARGEGPRRRSGARPGTSRWRALDLGLPCAAAVLVDAQGGAVPIAAGYACRLSRDAALLAALLEAAQTRLTEIHGAREDVAHGGREAAAPLAGWCAATRPIRRGARMPDVRARTPAAGVRQVLARMRRARLGGAVVRLPAPPRVHVVKVLVPGLLLSELL